MKVSPLAISFLAVVTLASNLEAVAGNEPRLQGSQRHNKPQLREINDQKVVAKLQRQINDQEPPHAAAVAKREYLRGRYITLPREPQTNELQKKTSDTIRDKRVRRPPAIIGYVAEAVAFVVVFFSARFAGPELSELSEAEGIGASWASEVAPPVSYSEQELVPLNGGPGDQNSLGEPPTDIQDGSSSGHERTENSPLRDAWNRLRGAWNSLRDAWNRPIKSYPATRFRLPKTEQVERPDNNPADSSGMSAKDAVKALSENQVGDFVIKNGVVAGTVAVAVGNNTRTNRTADDDSRNEILDSIPKGPMQEGFFKLLNEASTTNRTADDDSRSPDSASSGVTAGFAAVGTATIAAVLLI